jgi:diguanylate cyclase (GGDEF)-like protein
MGWQFVVVLNAIIASCYVAISFLIGQGLVRTRQVTSNPLALATCAIFMTCAVHHGEHALHLALGDGDVGQLRSARALFGQAHMVAIDGLGAIVAVTYLALRRNYKALLNTPAMFDDAVRVAAEGQLRELAFTDQLTGVPNRAAYQLYADGLAAGPRPVAVLFIDLDGFKQINDLHGHDAGDRLLRELAQRISRALSPEERLFRIGGDEFVVVSTTSASPDGFSERVGRLIRQPIDAREGPLQVEASIGLAVGPAGDGLDRLVREADAHMYRIKSQRQRTS